MIRSERAVHDLGELPLQAAQGLTWCLLLGELAAVVLLAETRMHRLHARSEVERVVQRAIPCSTQAMTAYVTAGGFDRSSAGVAGVVSRGGKACDVPGVTEDLGRQHIADPQDLRQRAATCSDSLCASLPTHRELAVEPAHISDEYSRHALAFMLDGGHGVNRGDQRGRILGCQVGWRATRAQISEQPMQPVDRPSTLLGQLVPSVGKEPQDRSVILTGHVAAYFGGNRPPMSAETDQLFRMKAISH